MSQSISSIKELDPLDNIIYKVKYIINDHLDTIYVFYGKKGKDDSVFNEQEKNEINSNKTKVIFSQQRIHPDDTIATIKIKILNELKKNISVEEMYLFYKKIEKLNSVSIYQSLTQNKKIALTKLRLDQFIQNIRNIDNHSLPDPEEKDVYSYSDIFEMGLDHKEYIVNKTLGQKYFIVENEYPYVCNPFDVKQYDTFFEKNSRKSLTTLNNYLLLNSGQIVDNSIYLCLAKDVLQYVDKQNISDSTTLKIYYPFLYNKNINSLEDLERKSIELVESNKKFINKDTNHSFDIINMFYNVYDMRKHELDYTSRGIKNIKAVMKPLFDVKIPLEVIFKIVHATKTNPLIKYNPSSRQENIYRLYSDKISTDGRKIPYLKKASIFKLMKGIAKNKSVGVFIETDDLQNIHCEFDEDGYITISAEFGNLTSISKIDNIFRSLINPVIQEIKTVLEQSGYTLNLFNSLNDDNVDIKHMTYETNITIKKPFNIDKYKGCISSVFINETDKYKGNTFKLRFKKVSNYSKFNSQEAFIIEKAKQDLSGPEIIKELLENFPDDLTEEQAVDLVRKFAMELEVERGFRKSDIKIKENPGFKTEISVNTENANLKIVVENINNINYLYTIPIYLDTIVRLTQEKTAAATNKLCNVKEVVDIQFPDITSSTEESFTEGEHAEIEGDETIDYEKYNKIQTKNPKGAFSLFFDDDSDESYVSESGQLLSGGQDSSEESLPSMPSINSEESLPSMPSIKSEESLPSMPSIKSDKSLSSIPSIKSEESLPSIKSDKSLSSKPSIKSEESMPSIKLEESKPSIKSEESIPSIKSLPSETINKHEEVNVEEEKKDVEEEKKDEEEEKEDVEEEKEDEEEEKEDEEEEKEDEEEEKEDEEEEEKEDEEEDIRNIDGMKLNTPYYFQTLIEKKDPVLIVKQETPEFNSYARTCLSDKRRQPVILSDSQLEKINKENPGFLREQDVIKYGSDEKHQFNYICPRYWCLKNNTIIDPKDLHQVKDANGKIELVHKPSKGPSCGKVLPKKEKSVKPGYYIYEFNDEGYPGLIPDKHPKGYCLPCCFKKYNTIGRITAKKSCLEKNDETNEKRENKNEEKDYILGPEKFPLDSGRWGYLPPEMQIMLREMSADCQVSKTNSAIKENHPCLLRHGVEISKNQSFIAAISDILFYGKRASTDNNQLVKVLSIKEMKERIIKSIDIDSFIKYQNGNLVTNFQNDKEEVDFDKYKESKLYSKINMEKVDEKSYFTKVVSAFENFKLYLKDDNALIDHTYLWDIVSTPNNYLFKNGVNLIIFQLPHDDITNNVQIICPSNHYSNEFYQARKPSVILIKEDGYYEPVYSYLNGKHLTVAKEFKEHDPQLSKTMRAIFKELIKPLFESICRPLESMPNVYKAKKPLLLYDLIQKLDKYQYKIKKLVMNFNNKIIGVFAEEPGSSNKKGFVPCYPSTLNESIKNDLDFVFMNDLELWNTYNETVEFLTNLHKKTSKRRESADIPCKPAFKIIEDELIVGILTETNQFIQVSEPIDNNDIRKKNDLPAIKDTNYIVNPKDKVIKTVDSVIMTEKEVDKEREDYIKKIKLETSFYNVFRNTIRILINNYENIKIREKIENDMSNQYMIYSDKLDNIDKLLRELVKEQIQFIGDNNYYKLINEVSTCLVKDKDKCKDSPNLCVVTENGKCNIILPERNLITNKLNEPIYFGRMSDELIRYNRIKSFMMQPQTYLAFGNIGYNLRDNEMILIQSMLTQEYFENLVPTITNKYLKYNSYDETQPIITQTYENRIASSDYAIGRKTESFCSTTENDHITSSLWKKCFPKNYKEIEYGRFHFCTFQFIIDLIDKKTGDRYEINEIKNQLYDEYKKYIPENNDKIIDILITEGKKTLGDQVRGDIISFASFIHTDNYFLTTFDLWLLINRHKIPTIFICQKCILETDYEMQEFVGYGEKEDKFAFILIPASRPEIIPNFKWIKSDKDAFFISLNELEKSCVDKLERAIEKKVSIDDYLSNFKITKKNNTEKQKCLLDEVIIDDVPKPKKLRIKKILPDATKISPEQLPEQIVTPPQKTKRKTKKLIIKGVIKGGRHNNTKRK